MPAPVERELSGLYVSCRHENTVRFEALAEASAALAGAGIPMLVLKGAALACLAYAEPALRPMSDVDLLVDARDLGAAREMLKRLGYRAAAPATASGAPHHAPPLVRVEQGVSISIELHHRLTAEERPGTRSPDPWASPTSFPAGAAAVPSQAPGHEAMLWHLGRHLRAHMSVFGRHRLVWLADIVSYAEHYADAIDWPALHARRPEVIRLLATVHHVTPLSEQLRRTAGIDAGHAPAGAGLDFEGWPRRAIAAQRGKGWAGIARDTLAPPEWWLRMHYGPGGRASVWWVRTCVHPWSIAGHGRDWLAGRVGRGPVPAGRGGP